MRNAGIWLTALAWFLALLPLSAIAQQRHPLTIDDVLDTQRIDQAILSPDGKWIAAIIQRPARAGEVYGRLPYETIAQSPANIRSIFAETLAWFDTYLRPLQKGSR